MRDAEEIGVDGVIQHNRVLGEGGLHRRDLIAVASGQLVLLRLGGFAHPASDRRHVARVVAAHEAREVEGDGLVLLERDAGHARGRALADVTEQARTARLLGALVGSVRAAAHREGLEHDVDRLANRPRSRVRAEVPRVRDAAVAGDEHPRHGITQRDGQVGVALVVLVLHVEGRVELLDPGVLELQRLEVVAHDCPLHRGGGLHHLAGAVMQGAQGGEVVAEAGAEVLGLAHVQHSGRGIPEPVDARLGRDLTRLRAPADRLRHALPLARRERPPASQGGRCRCGCP